ncbi:MAG: DUF3048 domain-containing protein [Ferrimicrobium sp.]
MAGRHSNRGRRGLVVALIVVVVAVAAGSYLFLRTKTGATTGGSVGTPTTIAKVAAPVTNNSPTCPLTGLAAPNGKVPNRPALAIKVGNDPGARPQSGLSKADIVYEVQAEGGITRFIAVYQCSAPPLVGPIRSIRWVDWHVVSQLGNPILTFAGGINPDIYQVSQQSWLYRVDALSFNGAPFERVNNRIAPENLYGSPVGIWSLDPSHTAPTPIFSFSKTPVAGGSSVGGVTLPYSTAEYISWHWNASAAQWQRYYSGVPAATNSGGQISATNVVVQFVNAVPGSYNESGPNSLGVHSQTIGSGTVWVLRNGELIKGTWSRPAAVDPTTYTTSSGSKIALAAGRTWVEVVPQWVHASIQ